LKKVKSIVDAAVRSENNGSSGPVVIYLLVVCAISVASVLLLPGKLGKADPLKGLQPATAA